MSELHQWHHEKLGEKAVESLKHNGFDAVYFTTAKKAAEYILSLVPAKSSIGIGGSDTTKSLQVIEYLENQGNQILDHNLPGLSNEEKGEIRLKQQTCDVFLTSSNAITLDGKLVNMDGIGNRVSAMIFGPKKVIIVAGINKLVRNLDQALDRIQTVASPLNNKRLNIPNPCVEKGICVDCHSPSRICNVLTIIHKKPLLTDTTVVIVGENLGY